MQFLAIVSGSEKIALWGAFTIQKTTQFLQPIAYYRASV